MSASDSYNKDDPWFSFWVENSMISIERVFEEGGRQNLLTAKGACSTIALAPRFGNRDELVGFKVHVVGSALKPAWDGITLAPMGTAPIELKEILPRWNPDGSHEIRYSVALNPVEAEFRNNATTNLQRLEGYLPVTDETTGSFNIDRVRIGILRGIVEGGGDLALVCLKVLETHGATARQDGGGSGPPHRP